MTLSIFGVKKKVRVEPDFFKKLFFNRRRILIAFLSFVKIGKKLFKIQLHKTFYKFMVVKKRLQIIIVVMFVATAFLKVLVDLLGLILEIIKL